MDCKKCGSVGSVTLRKRDLYCDHCFQLNTVHKFRASIGKNKILAKNENVLICLSGGKSSTVLLELIHNGIVLDNHKKLRINPVFLHLSNGDLEPVNHIIEQCKAFGFDVYIGNITDYVEPNLKKPDANSVPSVNDGNTEKFNEMLMGVPISVCNDIILKIKRNLFIKYANLFHCDLIFTAETTTSLATNLLSNISIGRGSQIQNDIGFIDNRDEKIKIIRPMKDISQEELDNYIRIKQLTPIHLNVPQENSIQSVISKFVTDLQDNFQSTVSTMCKTADKIGVHNDDRNENNNHCIMCESDLNRKPLTLSALEATEFSRVISHKKPWSILINSDINEEPAVDNCMHDMTMFPYIHKTFCYTCSRNYAQMNECHLPLNIRELIQK